MGYTKSHTVYHVILCQDRQVVVTRLFFVFAQMARMGVPVVNHKPRRDGDFRHWVRLQARELKRLFGLAALCNNNKKLRVSTLVTILSTGFSYHLEVPLLFFLLKFLVPFGSQRFPTVPNGSQRFPTVPLGVATDSPTAKTGPGPVN